MSSRRRRHAREERDTRDCSREGLEELDWRRTRLGEISLRRRLDANRPCRCSTSTRRSSARSLLSCRAPSPSARSPSPIARSLASLLMTSMSWWERLGLGYTAHPRPCETPGCDPCASSRRSTRSSVGTDVGCPVSEELTSDPRCTLVEGDFFEMIASGSRFGPDTRDHYDAILVDIDHTPRHVLHPARASTSAQGSAGSPSSRTRRGIRLVPTTPPTGIPRRPRDVFASCRGAGRLHPLTVASGDTVYIACDRRRSAPWVTVTIMPRMPGIPSGMASCPCRVVGSTLGTSASGRTGDRWNA